MEASTSGRPNGLPPAMEGIVEDVLLRSTNYLTYNRVYSKVGHTQMLISDPGVLHFGGFQLGQVYRQVLRIRNVKARGSRMHIIPPTTAFFKATCNSKRGLVAPGLDEEIEVEFCPQQWRYYYDCIRIHSEDENLLVPIHGYPIMNETKFPRRIDFGVCALGEARTKRVKVECKVPVEFEFDITPLKPNPLFSVEPTHGVVPAQGSVTVIVTFHPITLCTEEMVLQVRIAEFNSQPITCTVTGSAGPGVLRDRLLAATLGSRLPTMEQLDGTQALKAAALGWSSNAGGGHAKGGAGGGDAFSISQRKQASAPRDCRVTGPIKSRLPLIKAAPAEAEVNGIYVPPGLLLTQADLSYVLNQEGGKLRIKDIKSAIEVKKQQLAVQQAALDEVLQAGVSDGVHPLERPDYSPDVKAALFQMQLQQTEAANKKANLGSAVCIGQDLMSSEEVRDAQRLRQQQHQQHQLSTELIAAGRLDAEVEACGALHVPCAASTSGHGDNSVSMLPAAHVPEWRLLEGNDWRKRSASLQRFVEAVRRVVYNRRKLRRLDRIKDVLARLGHDKQRLAEESANPVLLVQESDRPGTAPTKHLRPDMVRTQPLPLYRECNFGYHGPLPMSHCTDFDELAPHALKVPLEYKLLGYSPEEFPGLTTYAPPLLDQPLMEGAAEESLLPTPSGIIPPPDAYPRMPDSCKQMPFVVLEIGNRYSDDKVYAQPGPSWGMDTSAPIQPRMYPLHDSTQNDAIASGGVRALRGAPMLSDTWLPRRDTWQVQLTDEFVPALMSGPDPADLFADGLQDIDKPPIIIKAPSAAELETFKPRPQPAPPALTAEAAAAAAAAPPAKVGAKAPVPTPGKAPPGATTGKGAPTAAASAATAVPTSSAAAASQYVKHKSGMERRGREVQLDRQKAGERVEALARLDAKLAEYNATLQRPGQYSVIL